MKDTKLVVVSKEAKDALIAGAMIGLVIGSWVAGVVVGRRLVGA